MKAPPKKIGPYLDITAFNIQVGDEVSGRKVSKVEHLGQQTRITWDGPFIRTYYRNRERVLAIREGT